MNYTIIYLNEGKNKRLINVLTGNVSNISKIKEDYEVIECTSISQAIEALNANFPGWDQIIYFFTALK